MSFVGLYNNNTLSLFHFLAGMNMNPVSRLKKTWGKVNTDKFDILVVRKILQGRGKDTLWGQTLSDHLI